MREFDIDLAIVETVREEAFGGKCSVNVINTAGVAQELLSDEKAENGVRRKLLAPIVDFTVPIGGLVDSDDLDEDSRAIEDMEQREGTLSLAPILEQYNGDGDDWIRIGLTQPGGNQKLYFASIKLNDPKHKCSVILFEPEDEHDTAWAQNIVATTDDEQGVLTSIEGDFRYNLDAVVAVYDLLHQNNKESFLRTVEALKLESLVYARMHAPQLATEEQNEREGKLEFLQRILADRIGSVSVGEQVELFRRTGEISDTHTRGVASRFILLCCLERTEHNRGAISWPLLFGQDAESALARTEYFPTTYVETGGSSRLITDSGEVITQPDGSLEQLAKGLGYRDVTVIPEPAAAGERVYASFDKQAIGNIFPNDFETAKQMLADTMADLAEKGKVTKFTKLVTLFQRQFRDELDLLDIGHIKFLSLWDAEVSFDEKKLGVLFGVSNIAGRISAPGWSVLQRAAHCEDVVIESSSSAFTGATHIRRCSVNSTDDAFMESSNVQDCAVQFADQAFTRASYVSGCIATNCGNAFAISGSPVSSYAITKKSDPSLPPLLEGNRAINCRTAFEILDEHSQYSTLGRFGIQNIRAALKGNVWESQKSAFTNKPHRVVNAGRYWH